MNHIFSFPHLNDSAETVQSEDGGHGSTSQHPDPSLKDTQTHHSQLITVILMTHEGNWCVHIVPSCNVTPRVSPFKCADDKTTVWISLKLAIIRESRLF